MDISQNNNENTKSSDSGKRFPDLAGWIIFVGLTIGGVALDLWSKAAVFTWLGQPQENNSYTLVPGFLQFITRLNTGAAFSLAQGQRPFLVSISVVAFFVVTGFFIFGRIHRRIMQISLGCIMAGILGNLYDRAFNDGMVRDFIDAYIGQRHWPTFNVADSLLCIGVGLMIIANLTVKDHAESDKINSNEINP